MPRKVGKTKMSKKPAKKAVKMQGGGMVPLPSKETQAAAAKNVLGFNKTRGARPAPPPGAAPPPPRPGGAGASVRARAGVPKPAGGGAGARMLGRMGHPKRK